MFRSNNESFAWTKLSSDKEIARIDNDTSVVYLPVSARSMSPSDNSMNLPQAAHSPNETYEIPYLSGFSIRQKKADEASSESSGYASWTTSPLTPKKETSNFDLFTDSSSSVSLFSPLLSLDSLSSLSSYSPLSNLGNSVWSSRLFFDGKLKIKE